MACRPNRAAAAVRNTPNRLIFFISLNFETLSTPTPTLLLLSFFAFEESEDDNSRISVQDDVTVTEEEDQENDAQSIYPQQQRRRSKNRNRGSISSPSRGRLIRKKKKKSKSKSSHVLTESSQNTIHNRRISTAKESTTMSDSAGKRTTNTKATLHNNRKDDASDDDGLNDVLHIPTPKTLIIPRTTEEKKALLRELHIKVRYYMGREDDLEGDVDDLEKENKELKDKNQSLMSKNQSLTSKIQTLEKKRKHGALGVPHNKVLWDWMRGVVKTNVSEFIFVGHEEDELELMNFILQQSPDNKKEMDKLNDAELRDYLLSYVYTYGDKICNIINTHRNTVASALHKSWNNRMQNGGYIPEADDLLQIMKRKGLRKITINPEAADQEKEKAKVARYNVGVKKHWCLFDWLVGDCIRVVAVPKRWQEQRFYGALSVYSPSNDPQNPWVTPADEALVMVMLENYESRWNYELRCKNNGTKVDRSHEEFQTLYTDNKCGQCKYGGWNQDGRDRYEVLKVILRK